MSVLQEFPYKSHYKEVSGFSMHYIDEGDPTAHPVLFLHGVPTWSYTFRKIIPGCVEAGLRVIAPDMIGYGLSDKPAHWKAYSLSAIVQRTEEFIRKLEIEQLVLFAHDWGAVIGMLLASRPDNSFKGMVLSNGLLPLPGMKTSGLFRIWRQFARISPILPVGTIVNYGTKRKLSDEEKHGYNLPYKSNREKRAIRFMPLQLPLGRRHSERDMAVKAWSALEKWNKPLLTVFGDSDPITRGGERILQRMIPGALDQNHIMLKGGHYIQEDAPHEISKAIIMFMKG